MRICARSLSPHAGLRLPRISSLPCWKRTGLFFTAMNRISLAGLRRPLERVIDQRAFLTRSRPKRLNERIWQRIASRKDSQPADACWSSNELHSPHLELALKSGNIDEGNCARRYWQLYFPCYRLDNNQTAIEGKYRAKPNAQLRLHGSCRALPSQPYRPWPDHGPWRASTPPGIAPRHWFSILWSLSVPWWT